MDKPKKYPEPQAFEEGPAPQITLNEVESSQVKAIGYDDATSTLAVTFTRGTGAIYHYPGVSRETFEQFLKAESIGVFAATSRHIAMEAAEAGADYVAFAQASQAHGEPLIGWWQDIFEVPAVAFDPVDADGLAALLPQKPDFIRPMDGMWTIPEEASRVIAALTRAMA